MSAEPETMPVPLWTPRRRTPIGLDIGDSAIRAVQLRRSAEGYTLAAAAHVERAASPDPDPAGRLASALGTLLRESSFGGRAVVTALNPPQVEFHVLDLPAAVLRAQENVAVPLVHYEVGRLTKARS
jgi:Tfp pilus assembly PilM family ATPase